MTAIGRSAALAWPGAHVGAIRHVIERCRFRRSLAGRRWNVLNPETKKPARRRVSRVCMVPAPDERLLDGRPRFWRDWNLVDFFTYLKGYL